MVSGKDPCWSGFRNAVAQLACRIDDASRGKILASDEVSYSAGSVALLAVDACNARTPLSQSMPDR
jgi:hypothetical protein